MADLTCDDPEPCERFPAGPLYVPVRPGPAGSAARLFRSPLGDRTAVGFTSEQRLKATLGRDQAWIRLAEPALRALTAPLGVTTVTIDPQFSAPAPARDTSKASAPTAPPAPEPASAPRKSASRAVPETPRDASRKPHAVGVLRVTGAAALVSALALWIG
ncbi:SAV_915 family protein [Streptomyces sp. NPDC002309]